MVLGIYFTGLALQYHWKYALPVPWYLSRYVYMKIIQSGNYQISISEVWFVEGNNA